MKERLQKFMANCGIDSRRKCENIILEGRVQVNGKVVNQLGIKIDPNVDVVYVDNKLVKIEEKKVYIMLNKPEGYICSVKDEKNRKTVLDLVKVKERIYPIGRLDYNTSGLLLLTNDGEIYNKIMHPRNEIEKTYIAYIKGTPTKEEIYKFCNGVDIGGYITAKAYFKIIEILEKDLCKVEIKIHEGKNRQVRKMCKSIKHPVIKLKRISIGKIKLTNINEGQWRNLNDNEIIYLNSL